MRPILGTEEIIEMSREKQEKSERSRERQRVEEIIDILSDILSRSIGGPNTSGRHGAQQSQGGHPIWPGA